MTKHWDGIGDTYFIDVKIRIRGDRRKWAEIPETPFRFKDPEKLDACLQTLTTLARGPQIAAIQYAYVWARHDPRILGL